MNLDYYTLVTIHKKPWFTQLPVEQQELLAQSFYLYEDVQLHQKQFYDYSFIVMPASKAYEGFVKDMLYALQLISKKRYIGKRFRVGKALNPDIAKTSPGSFEVLYDDLKKISKTEQLPRALWETWRDCRNHVFHYYINQNQKLSLLGALEKVQQICSTIDSAALFLSTHF